MILSGAVSCLPSCTEPFFVFFLLTQFLIFLGINYKPSMCIMAYKNIVDRIYLNIKHRYSFWLRAWSVICQP